MSGKEFHNEFTPLIRELQNECSKLSEAEFCCFQEQMMDEFK